MEIKSQIDLDKLQQRYNEEREEIFKIASQILAELEVKLLDFANMAAEQVFKSNKDVSKKFDQTIMFNFKKDIRRVAQDKIDSIIKELGDENIWLAVTYNHSDRDSLTHNTKVWTIIKNFGESLWDVFKKYGYAPMPPNPTQPDMPPYKETVLEDITKFNKPDQLRLLCIKYWFHVSEYCKFGNMIKKYIKKEEDQSLEEIWKSIE